MDTARRAFETCVLNGEMYVTGGLDANNVYLSSVEKYSLSSDTWTAVAPMPVERASHATVALGSAVYAGLQ
jgi:hypothetical protein